MKKLIALITLVASIAILQACTDSNAAKTTDVVVDQKTAYKSLMELGFSNVPSVSKADAVNRGESIRKKYGLSFISDKDMQQLTKDNHILIQGHASSYNGEIPPSSAQQIVANYNKITSEKIYYYDDFWGAWAEVGIDHYGDKKETDKGILIIAPPTQFTPNADINSKKDPIAVIKIDGGFIELAAW